jgi:hypothetical protein
VRVPGGVMLQQRKNVYDKKTYQCNLNLASTFELPPMVHRHTVKMKMAIRSYPLLPLLFQSSISRSGPESKRPDGYEPSAALTKRVRDKLEKDTDLAAEVEKIRLQDGTETADEA